MVLQQRRLTRFLARMKKSAVSPEEMLAACVAMFLKREHDPLAFPSDRHFRHQLARYFIRLAPSPYCMTWNNGRGAKKYDRITAPTRELLYRRLSETIGSACLRMANAIYQSNLIETGLLRGINEPFNFNNQKDK